MQVWMVENLRVCHSDNDAFALTDFMCFRYLEIP